LPVFGQDEVEPTITHIAKGENRMNSEVSISEKPKSNRKWFLVGGFALVCLCLVATAIVLVPPIMATLNLVNRGTNYSGVAEEQLKADVLNAIANYESSQNGCRDVTLFTGKILVSPDHTGKGAWSEIWQVNACNASHLYSVSFTPAAGGGTDFFISRADP
jgi:hypothetical protein